VKLFHVNLLKPYHAHPSSVSSVYQQGSVGESPVLVVDTAGVVSDERLDDVCEPDKEMLSGRLKNSKTLRDLKKLLMHLTKAQALEFEALILKYPNLFGDVPNVLIGQSMTLVWVRRCQFVSIFILSSEKRNYLDAEDMLKMILQYLRRRAGPLHVF